MAVKVGINGFGRIGRNIFRTALGDSDIDFVAVNDLTDTKTLAHLLKYDSVLGNLDHQITSTENGISVEGEEFKVFSQRDPAAIDWESVGADIVIESTGIFTKAEEASAWQRQKSDHLSSREERRHHDRSWCKRKKLRSGEAPHHFECFVHYELPGACGQGCS
jgi:glyceraldehyde-3-phosphate dehydrogenase/erythrose-4-phosphate dehydrogenase